MKRYIVVFILLFLTNMNLVKGEHNPTLLYATPGLQLTYNMSEGVSLSGQVTFGLVFDEHSWLPYPGITFGYRKYFKTYKTYSYKDLQLATPLGGIGLGLIKGVSTPSSEYRFKAWGGFLLNVSYDGIINDKKLKKHNFGAVGVFPILLIPGMRNYTL